MIPRFARNGFLPPGLHPASWEEVAARFGEATAGTNGRRRRLLHGLARALLELAKAGSPIAYLDGSFVSRERWPKDFDVCYELVGARPAELEPTLRDFSDQRRAQRELYGGDILPRDFPFSFAGDVVFDAFQRHRLTREPKGMVTLDLQVERANLERWLEENS